MNVVYASNDNYAWILCVSMLSLFENNRDLGRIRVFILADSLSDDSIVKLRQTADRYGRELIIIDAAEFKSKIPFDFDTCGYNPIVMSRLFLGSYLPDDAERALYLDCDTVVSGSLRELEEIDLGDCLVAAVPELNMPPEKKAVIGFAREDCYYNAGLLLADVARWRKENLEKKFIDFYGKMKGRLLYNDQDIINHCCKGRIHTLHLKYNLSGNHFYFHRFMVNRLQPAYALSSAAEFNETMARPAVIHYMGDERPWIAGNRNRYRAFFEKYKAMSPYSDVPQIEGRRIYMLCYRLLNIATFICPWFRLLFTKFIGINKYIWAGKE